MKSKLLLLSLIVLLVSKLSVPPTDTSSTFSACPLDSPVYGPLPQSTSKVPAVAAIVPHHLLASDIIHETLAHISPGVRTVILVGPNHFLTGLPPVQTTTNSWLTSRGILAADTNVITNLLSPDVGFWDGTFVTEHSICGLVTFVKSYFPKARLVPLVLRPNISSSDLDALAERLTSSCHRCLLLASVDFTHDSSPEVASANDSISAEILTSLDLSRSTEIVADSQASLYLAMAYAKLNGISKGKLISSSNSNAYSPTPLPTVTSYVSVLYTHIQSRL